MATTFKQTCRQSSEVLTILGHFDRQASSNGRKYLSAFIKFDLALGAGRADDADLLSALQSQKNNNN